MSTIDPVSLAIAGLSSVSAIQQQRAGNKAAAARQQAQNNLAVEQRRIEERREKERLKRELASRRARFGARGLSSTGGSNGAILAGLRQISDRAIGDNRRLDAIQRSGQPSLFDDKFGLAANVLDQFNSRVPIMSLFKD